MIMVAEEAKVLLKSVTPAGTRADHTTDACVTTPGAHPDRTWVSLTGALF